MAFDLLARGPENGDCIITESQTLTRCQIRDLGNQFEVRENISLAFLVATNCPESIAIYAKLLSDGTTCCLLDKAIRKEILAGLIERYKPDVLYAPHDFNADGIHVLWKDKIGTYYILKLDQTSKNINKSLALLLPTSGSTGSPKFVRISYQNLKANTESIIQYLGIDSSSRHITSLPMSYTYGLSCINTHLYGFGSVVCTEKSVITRDFWDLVSQYKVTTFSGVPYTYELILRNSSDLLDRSTINTFTQAGGKLKEWCLEKLIDIAIFQNKRVFIMYGQTEATARISYLPHNMLNQKKGSIGVAIPGGALSLGNTYDSEESIGGFKTGELVFRGPNVSLGYADCLEDLALGDTRNGILETGDIGYCDDDGYWHITSRVSDFAKIAGKRVCLTDIEKELNKTGLSLLVMSNDEILSVFIEEHSQNSVLLEDIEFKKKIKKEVSRISSIHPAQIKVQLVPSFPRLPSGKVNKKELVL